MSGSGCESVLILIGVLYMCMLAQLVIGRVHTTSNGEYREAFGWRNAMNANEPVLREILHHSVALETAAKQREVPRLDGNLPYRGSVSASREFVELEPLNLGERKLRRSPRRATVKREDALLSRGDEVLWRSKIDAVKRNNSQRRKRKADIFDFYRSVYDNELNAALEFIKYNQEQGHNCTHVTLPSLNINSANDTYSEFKDQAKAAVKTANLLNTFYQTTPTSGSANSFLGDDKTYFSLVRNNVESDDNIFGCCIAFGFQKYKGDVDLFAPYAYRAGEKSVVTKDLANLNYTSLQDGGFQWFLRHSEKPPDDYRIQSLFGYHIPRYNQTEFADTINVSHLFIEETEGSWSAPYFDCGGGQTWLVTYSVPFYGNDHEFRGVVSVDIDLRKVDINQCANDASMFASTHKCKNTTQCSHVPGQGFTSGAYQCVCKENYYFPVTSSPSRAFNGTDLEEEYRLKMLGLPNRYDQGFECLPCPEGCDGCVDNTPCFIEENKVLRYVLLGIEMVCMVFVLILMILIFRYRKFKVVSHDSPYMLEIVLFGALLLYGAVVARYFPPDTLICFLVRWLREWGFAVAYGTLILKTYRVLAVFQTRSATRVLVRDRDLIKWLGLILFILTGYLAAWTAYSLEEINKCGNDMLDVGLVRSQGLKYYVCITTWWDIAIEAAEFLFLIFGIYLCYLVRSAPSEFHETRYISIAIYNETIFSLFLHVARQFVWLMAGPDWIYLMYVIRSQLTTTVMIGLVFFPKLAVVYKMKTSEHFRDRAYSEGLSLESKIRSVTNSSNSYNNPDFNQEDVRDELKRLYTQLEIYKTKTMKIDNPHIPKKKGGLGARWKTARKFSRRFSRSLQAPGHDSDRERSSEIARSNESLARPMEMDDVKNSRDDADHRDVMIGNSTRHYTNPKWMCQQ
ncbi:metabotropic glycine receptor-like [Ptychodera flava]|uniref:metabotropic glycine receptor-like n=1 Tax=Ptychodera flava TaxID=63121 RepID=UPI003969E8E2